MPANRSILSDITACGADPSKPHAVIGASGRLRLIASVESSKTPETIATECEHVLPAQVSSPVVSVSDQAQEITEIAETVEHKKLEHSALVAQSSGSAQRKGGKFTKKSDAQ